MKSNGMELVHDNKPIATNSFSASNTNMSSSSGFGAANPNLNQSAVGFAAAKPNIPITDNAFGFGAPVVTKNPALDILNHKANSETFANKTSSDAFTNKTGSSVYSSKSVADPFAEIHDISSDNRGDSPQIGTFVHLTVQQLDSR